MVYEKKRSNGNGENERKKEKKKAMERIREKKNPEERERIDKISSWYNILIQEIQLLKKLSFREAAGA